jgi:hypothetical protein
MDGIDFSDKSYQALAVGLANAGVTAFELLSKRSGYLAIGVGGASLAYATYEYMSDSATVAKNRNAGDSVDDVISSGVDVISGAFKGTGFILENLQVILIGGAAIAGLFFVYEFTRSSPTIMVAIQQSPQPNVMPGPNMIPAIIGGAMGLTAAAVLYMDSVMVKDAKRPGFGHDVVKTVSDWFS